MWRLIVVGLAGCGRIGFQPFVCDLPAGHDEDGDTIDDACDVCPHLPDRSQPDRDGDGVGDACDPNPATATESIVIFDPFVTRRPEWESLNMTVIDDRVVFDGTYELYLLRGVLPARDVIAFAGAFGNPTTASQQLLIGFDHSLGGYYCELFYDGVAANAKLGLTQITPTLFIPLAVDLFPGPLTAGAFAVTIRHDGAGNAECTSMYSRPLAVTANIANAGTPEYTVMRTAGIAGHLDYFLKISSD